MSEEEKGELQKNYILEWLVPGSLFMVKPRKTPGIFSGTNYQATDALRDGANDLVKEGYRIISLTSYSQMNGGGRVLGTTDGFIGVVDNPETARTY